MSLNIPTSVACIGPKTSCIYYFYNKKLIVVQEDGVFVTEYYCNVNIGDVVGVTYAGPIECSDDYDGAIFVTFENKGSDISFKRWVIDFNQQSIVLEVSKTYPKHSYYYFDYRGITVQTYKRSMLSALSSGSNHVNINNSSFIEADQLCVLGPSTEGYSYGKTENVYVDHVDGSIVYFKTNAINSYKPGDKITFVGDVLTASKRGISGSSIPVLYYLDLFTLTVSTYRSVYQIASVTDIDFNNDLLYMGSKYSIYMYRCDGDFILNIIYTYQNCGGYEPVYNILVKHGSTFYTVQKNKITFSNYLCSSTPFSTFGIVSNMTSVYINTVAVAMPYFITSTELHGEIYVMDQYSRGLMGIVVTVFSDDGTGHITCSNHITDIYGKVYFSYTVGNNTEQIVTARVNSTYPPRSSDYVFGRCFFNRELHTITTSSHISKIDKVTSRYVTTNYATDLEYNLSIENVDGTFKCRYGLDHVRSPVYGYSNVTGSVKDKNTANSLVCNANISDTGTSKVYTAITAYTNGPISTTTSVDTFIFLSYFKPNPFSDRNDVNSIIDFYVFPSSYLLDSDTLHVNIREINDYRSYDSGWVDVVDDGTLTLIDIGGRYAIKFTYIKPTRYFYNSTVYCVIEVYDKAPSPNLYRYECYFGIIPDYKKPEIVEMSPYCGASDVSIDSDICVIVDDDGSGLDLDTLNMYVDGIPVYYTVYNVGNGTAVVYENSSGFFPGSFVTYSINISDVNGNKMHKACMFSVSGSNEPEIVVEQICGDVVDNRFSFYFDVFDAGSGVKYDEIELILHNKLAQFISKPILYRIK